MYSMINTNEIYNKDCIEGLLSLDNDSIDLCITSPPYNIGMDYGEGPNKDLLPWKDYFLWCEKWIKEIFRVLKPNRRFCLNHYLSCGNKNKRVAPLMELNQIAINIGFNHHALAIWEDSTRSRLTAWGSFMKASAPYIQSPYEGILILYKGEWKREDKGISTISKEDFIEAVSGIWKIHPEKKVIDHPAPYPTRLPTICINLLSYKNDLVLDPFMGTGTTAVACKQTDRNYIGFESNTTFWENSVKRVNNTKVLLNLR